MPRLLGDGWTVWNEPLHDKTNKILVWFYFCFSAFQHVLGHFGRGQLTYPHCSWASLLGSLPVLSAHYSPVTDWQLLFLNQRKGGMAVEMFSWPSLHERMSRKWGSNSGPLACQGNTQPIELPRPAPTKWLCAQPRLRSTWASTQADLSLRWAHMPFCWYVMRRLKYWTQQYLSVTTGGVLAKYWLTA